MKETRDRAASNVADLQETLRKEIDSRAGWRAFLRRAALAPAVAVAATAFLHAGALLRRDREALEAADLFGGWRDYPATDPNFGTASSRRGGRTMRCEIVSPSP